MDSPQLQAALTYAARGWQVFPVLGDKRPACRHGFKDASDDPSGVRALWDAYPAPGVGIRTGAASGILVVDVDTEKGGEDSLFELEQEHGEIPGTIEALTGGGGRHIFFEHPSVQIRNSVAKLGEGLDIRADGGYVVAPPSPHPSGKQYEWDVDHHPDDVELAPVPEWILDSLNKSTSPTTPIEEEIPEGERNSTLASLAGSMRHRGMGEAEIEAALSVANRDRCNPALHESEIREIAASIARYEPGAGRDHDRDHELERELEVVTAREICQLPDPPESDAVLGPLLVRRARTVIGAHTGEGKTSLALQMIHAAVMETEFLEWTGAGCRALMIDAEQGLRTIKRRLEEAGLEDSERVDYLRVPDGLALDEPGPDIAQIEQIFETGEYGLVVADPLYKLHRGESNEERHAVDLMRRLDAWRERFGFALLLLVHRRKVQLGYSRFTMDDLFGSSAYMRGAEVVLGLQRPSPGYARLHFFKDRDGDLPVGEKWGLLFDRDNGFRRDPEDDKPKETARDKIRKALEADPGRTVDQLAKTAGCTDRTARKALKDLDADHDKGPNGTKLWRLPDGDGEAQS